ncbi:4Fe-4S dicluster domain-containing protein, partial [Candidatus Woesearchaeota archaeon]|nr:4Fe-4S dicluster domain-containing protein [Candidatus Woesearchaeota archaeon]
MQNYFIKKGDVPKFVSSLQRKKYDVIAPVKRDIVRFCLLNEGEGISSEHPRYPVKEFFLPHKEKLVEYGKEGMKILDKVNKRVVFMHRCDANALLIIDKLYLENGHPDPMYKKYRENSVIIEMPCIPDKHCFCSSMDLVEAFDLRLQKYKNGYFVEVGTKKGQQLINNLFKKTNIKLKYHEPKCKKKIKMGTAKCMEYAKDYPELWKKYADQCLSCSACTASCPTCSCFSVKDVVNFNEDKGVRKRTWASCQGLDFTRVAGGYVFRQDRDKRVKQ